MKLTSFFLTAALVLLAAPASAHWQFAKWGMTPDQVIKASGGKAAWKDEKGVQVLSLDYPSGQFDLQVSFGFDATNHLNDVSIGSSTNVYGIINELKGKYGTPRKKRLMAATSSGTRQKTEFRR